MLQPLDVRPQHRRPEARVVQPELVRQLLGEIGIVYRVTNKNRTRLCSNIARVPIIVVALGHRAATPMELGEVSVQNLLYNLFGHFVYRAGPVLLRLKILAMSGPLFSSSLLN